MPEERKRFEIPDAPSENGWYLCPICGYPTLTERAQYEICRLCNWEDDGAQELDEYGGPNHCTVGEARENFAKYGTMYAAGTKGFEMESANMHFKHIYRALIDAYWIEKAAPLFGNLGRKQRLGVLWKSALLACRYC